MALIAHEQLNQFQPDGGRINQFQKHITSPTSIMRIASALLLCVSMVSCTKDEASPTHESKSIVILYDNDVHCNIDGYCKMAGLRDAILSADTSYVLTVSSGDYINGGLAGSISKGEYVIDVMNAVGYDVTTIGNHAFDFGMSRLDELMKRNKASVVCSNFTHADSGETVFSPYVIKTVGPKKIAFIGCSTPAVMDGARGVMYDAQGKQLLNMHSDDMAQMVQQSVDKARNEGADYVVLLSHLGEDATEAGSEWTSTRLIAETYGIDAVLDGHTHHIYQDTQTVNKKGQKVHLSQTGTSFARVGKLWIGSDGLNSSCTLSATDSIPYVSTTVSAAVTEAKSKIDKECSSIIGHTDYELIVDEPEEVEAIRCKETNFGDLVSDAFADLTSSQIGIVLSGTIRSNIKAGDITKGDIINTFIYDNPVVKLSITGRSLLTLLSMVNYQMPEKSAAFPQISGMSYTVDTSRIPATLTDVKVWDKNIMKYVDLDLAAKYEIALNELYITNIPSLFKDCEVLSYGNQLTDRECVTQFINKIPGKTIPADYSAPQGRIRITASWF